MNKQRKRSATGRSTSRDESGHRPAAAEEFAVETADAGQVVDEIVALRAALVAMEKSPFSAAKRAPQALRRLLEIIENLNLRLAELESGG